MRCVIQRVTQASVEIDGETVGRCGHGFLVLIGVRVNDTDADLQLSNSSAEVHAAFWDWVLRDKEFRTA